jgi:trypsin
MMIVISRILLFLLVNVIHAQQQNRIVGGGAAERGEFPYLVFLSNRAGTLTCGGTLISPSIVLTAAHCRRGILHTARVGLYVSNSIWEPSVEDRLIQREIKHPSYNPDTFQNDLMLLILESPVLNYPIVPLYTKDALISQQSLLALGWGYNSYSKLAKRLQQVELEYMPNEECKQSQGIDLNGAYGNYQPWIDDSSLCTHYSGNTPKDTCSGDSGGPLLNEEKQQVAVISWGMACGDPIFPGVSSRISYNYEKFIRPHICSIEGDSAPSSFLCDTFSGNLPDLNLSLETPPAVPEGKIRFWIVLYMDCWPDDISWWLQKENVETIIAHREVNQFNDWQDIVVEYVDLDPETQYIFMIEDEWGDGLSHGGYYELLLGGSDSPEEAQITIKKESMSIAKRLSIFMTPENNDLGNNDGFSLTGKPSSRPVAPTTQKPSNIPTKAPVTADQSALPTLMNSDLPTKTSVTAKPTTRKPINFPTKAPVSDPPTSFSAMSPYIISELPSDQPSFVPSSNPGSSPTEYPIHLATLPPTSSSAMSPYTPSELPSDQPRLVPSIDPGSSPTKYPIHPTTLPPDPQVYALCGDPSTLTYCGTIQTMASQEERHNVRCCSDAPKEGWKNNFHIGCSVWSQSTLLFGKDEAKCHTEATYSEAISICQANQARLCTKQEILKRCTAGSGCMFDRDFVWTSTMVPPPTASPSTSPSAPPTAIPSSSPSQSLSAVPTSHPTSTFSRPPASMPSLIPTIAQSSNPTLSHFKTPSQTPSISPSLSTSP